MERRKNADEIWDRYEVEGEGVFELSLEGKLLRLSTFDHTASRTTCNAGAKGELVQSPTQDDIDGGLLAVPPRLPPGSRPKY
jgi:hypothetical protein